MHSEIKQKAERLESRKLARGGGVLTFQRSRWSFMVKLSTVHGQRRMAQSNTVNWLLGRSWFKGPKEVGMEKERHCWVRVFSRAREGGSG